MFLHKLLARLPYSAIIFLSFGTGDKTQGSTHTEQVLYHWATSPAPRGSFLPSLSSLSFWHHILDHMNFVLQKLKSGSTLPPLAFIGREKWWHPPYLHSIASSGLMPSTSIKYLTKQHKLGHLNIPKENKNQNRSNFTYKWRHKS